MKVQQRRATELAEGYSDRHATVNLVGGILGVVLGLIVALVFGLGASAADIPVILLAVILGLATADLLTGLIHWGCDTWGSVELPYIGPTLIRSFREHHVDPMSITRHDWAEINGEACLAASPVLALLWLVGPEPLGAFGAWWALSTVIAAMMTNQVHQWAHMRRPPGVIRLLQRTGLILSVRAHAKHHRVPFAVDYCITTGWLNRPLNAVGFWRGLEHVVVNLTGALPREDDLGAEAAAKVRRTLEHKSQCRT